MFSNNKYILYNKNTPIMAFHCDRDESERPAFVEDKHLSDKLPFGWNNIQTWIENRRTPKHRAYIKELLDLFGCNDLESFVRFSFCASLNDSFWVKPEESPLKWEDVSLYTNRFDPNIAQLAFGTRLAGNNFSSMTPELTTDGTFPKCWKRFGEDICLLKQGSKGAVNAGREPFSELLAYEVSKIICDEPVAYDVIRYHGEIASKCRLFTNEDIGYSPAMSFIRKENTLGDMIKFFDKLGSGEQFRQMIILDALTLNTDRHLKNFGCLYDNNTMELLKMAPVFDNNLSMCPFAEIEDLKNIEKYMVTRQSAIGDGFNENAILCMTPDLKNRLYAAREINFLDVISSRFENVFPEERVQLLTNLVKLQAENIIKGKTIRIHFDKPKEEVHIAQFFISFKTDEIEKKMLDDLIHENVKIPDFSIYTESGNELKLSEIQYTAYCYDNTVEIDVFDCVTTGDTTELKVKGVDGLKLEGEVNDEIENAVLEIQLDRGDFGYLSELRDIKIPVKKYKSGSRESSAVDSKTATIRTM